MNIKLIVGLANVGEKYAKTRHNAGAWYIEMLAKRLYTTLVEQPKFYGLTSIIDLNRFKLHLLIPTTFMNMSGNAVATLAKFYKFRQNEILIVHDELNLKPGIIKLKFGGGHGGHNGLKDIINKLGNNNNFYRLRIGIGHPGDKSKVTKFVLDEPSSFEKELINSAIKKSIIDTELIIREQINKIK